jgi:hypothetical protein
LSYRTIQTFIIEKQSSMLKLTVGAIHESPLHKRTLENIMDAISPLRKQTLGNIVAYFKYQSTKLINELRDIPGLKVWQRNYLPCEVVII